MQNTESFYRNLLRPSEALLADMDSLDGDIIILGAGGKMGPDLCRLAWHAVNQTGSRKRIIAAARFSGPGIMEALAALGIETIKSDLLNDRQLQQLPQAENVLYLAGNKFGTTGNECFTWAMNAYLPGRVAEKYKNSRIVAFSTGNVYPMVPVTSGGAAEDQPPQPTGEYAQSCLGRERMFQYCSERHHTPVLIYRLNYANDVSYGVLSEIAKSVMNETPVDLTMGNVNVIWQGDANEMALRCLHHCSTPPKILNIAGPETASVKWLAEEFGKLFGKKPQFTGEEQSTAYLSNAAESFRLFGYPKVTLSQMISLIADWLREGGKTINKPTHFQERKGKF